MMIPSARQKHVEVRLVLRKSLKRRSKKTKKRKHKNKTTQVARSLITPSLLQESARFRHVSVFRSPTLSTQKIVNKKKQNPTDTQDDVNQALNHIHSIPIFDTSKQIQYGKSNSDNDHDNQHLTVLEASSSPINNTNLTADKMVLPTSHL
jgi:hypothetical protein